MGKKKLNLLKFFGILTAGHFAAGCATTEPTVDGTPVKTHYTLTTGTTIIHPGMLPRETPVFIEWHYSNGDKIKSRGFTGWDFDGDGRFEMVDVQGDNAAIEATVFDFDGDGKVDRKMTAADLKNGK